MNNDILYNNVHEHNRTMRSRGNGGACTMNDPNSRLMGFAVVVFDAKEFIELAVEVSNLCVLKFIYNVV